MVRLWLPFWLSFKVDFLTLFSVWLGQPFRGNSPRCGVNSSQRATTMTPCVLPSGWSLMTLGSP